MMILLMRSSAVLLTLIQLWAISEAREPSRLPAEEGPNAPESWVEMPNKIPCPDSDLIKPCICVVQEDYTMDMDCSDILGEDDLKRVFNHKFPFTEFRKLDIQNNKNLEVLRDGDLGNSSFVEINIKNCRLSEIEEHALVHSYDTLETLRLDGNLLFSTPELDVSYFKNLIYLSFQSNDFTDFPLLTSMSLQILILDGNRMGTVPAKAIKGLPALEVISLQHCSLSSVEAETFMTNMFLSSINLGSNNLTTIPQGTIHLHGTNGQLGLRNNKIHHLPKDSFSGVSVFMDMERNSLEELKEEVWRPLLDDGVYVTLEDNPFLCGCDVAWLVLNRTLIDNLSDTPTCSDGEAIASLDPAIYEAMCG